MSPGKYYPSGRRNFLRVVAADEFQGGIGAHVMKSELGVRKVYVLDDGSLYGKGVADWFANRAKASNLTVVGHAQWNRFEVNYRALMKEIKRSGADGVYIGGNFSRNGRRLIKDKLQILGGNKRVKLLVSDGFVGDAFLKVKGVNGAYGTRPADSVEATKAATQVLLDAIGRSDGSRKDVINKLFSTKLVTVIGPMSFDKYGDPRKAVETVKSPGIIPRRKPTAAGTPTAGGRS